MWTKMKLHGCSVSLFCTDEPFIAGRMHDNELNVGFDFSVYFVFLLL
jgi:hypothetical protein